MKKNDNRSKGNDKAIQVRTGSWTLQVWFRPRDYHQEPESSRWWPSGITRRVESRSSRIQGDEPLVSPKHIDKVIDYHKKNLSADIVLPTLKIKFAENQNIVKVVTDNKKNVLYLSRAKIPLEFKNKSPFFKKHLSIISFKKDALIKYSKSNKSNLEKIEDIELLRALETGLKIKTIDLIGDSFSIDVMADFIKAKKKFKTDKISKRYS